ncbi:MAG TPA: PA2778 family cysteine peptidase [Burkholderiales bacterium]|nr:PA2778 family cysteine peptidase [Burkholderiales bacterium]
MRALWRRRLRFACCALALAFCLAGCVSLPQSEALRAQAPGGLPPRVEIAGVPFYPPEDFLCGPAALAMVFAPAGVHADVEALRPLVYLPGRHGSLQAEMLGATRRSGLLAYPLAPRMQDLLRELAAGTPAVVLLNLSLRIAPIWHYAVILGYDLERRIFVVRSGARPREEWDFGFLEFLWRDGGYWSMLALAPGRLPASAHEPELGAAIAALEQAGRPREARASYRALLERWPASLAGLIGLGNTEYALGDRAAAERALRRAAKAHPDSVAALNNHAQVLAELGRLDEAERAARAAVALGGPLQAEARKTLESIVQRRAPRR